MEYDVLILGGGASGLSCALMFGSAREKTFAQNKKVGIILHQKTSDLQNAVYNNVLGLPAGTTGDSLLKEGPLQREQLYPEVEQIEKEKVNQLIRTNTGFEVGTNKGRYSAKKVVIAAGYSNLLHIKGLEEYIVPHRKSAMEKNRIQLKNEDYVVAPNLYVCGNLSGHTSQFSISCGSGAAVATDILREWNNGNPVVVHDKLK